MKRTLLSLLALLVALTGRAQTIGEAFYVYCADGMINAFIRSEVDSMAYSYYDVDSTRYDEIVTQVIYTPDSIYRIPLAMVDSVSFVTPPTVYKEDVTRMEYNLLDYVIGADGLTLKLKPNTPTMIIPVRGDKLVLLEGCDVLPYGFSGIVSQVEIGSSSIDVVCEQAYLEDLFDSFCSVTTAFGCNPDSLNAYSPSSRRRVTYSPDDIVFSLGPYKVSENKEVSLGLLFDNDLALKGGTDFTVEIQPTFRIHTFLMLSLVHGVNFSCSITGDLRVASQTSFYGGLKYNHDFDGLTIPFPIPMTAGLINFYINPGLFLRADATISANVKSTQVYTFGSSFGYSSNDQNTMSLDLRLAKSSFDAFGCIDGSVAGGAYLETGFNLKSRKIAKACIRGEFGGRFSGNFVLRNSDIVNAEKETKLYEKLKASSFEFGCFVSTSLQASVWKTTFSKTRELYKIIRTWDLVPTFSGTKLVPTPGYAASLDASTKLSGNCLFSVPVGFRLFDRHMNEVEDYDDSSSYSDVEREMKYTFSWLDESEPLNYKVYPTVNLFGVKEILAEPSAEIGIKPVTLEVEDITDTTAKAWGRIEWHRLLNESVKFGLAIQEVGNNETKYSYTSSIDEYGLFSVEFENLKPNTSYKYFAFVVIGLIGGEMIEGEHKEFTTDGQTEAYGVVTEEDTHLTYYYDGKKNKRTGQKVRVPYSYYNGYYDRVLSITTISFDASFVNFCPKSTSGWFSYMENLTSIEHIEYLNTSNVTDMSGMFNYCRSLTSLDLSKFNTAYVTNMSSMFGSCSSLTSLNISSFITPNVTSTSNMFSDCHSLTKLNLSSFNTTNVTSMAWMFYNCSSLTKLDLSSFYTINMTDMQGMFYGCKSLIVLDLSNFNTDKVTAVGCMFWDCGSLRTIYARNWERLNGYLGTPWIFDGCDNLEGGKGTKIGNNFYGYDENGNPLYYYCYNNGWAAHIDGGKDNPGLFTAK